MKTLKLILASVLISFGANAQKANVEKVEKKEIAPEQRAKTQTEKMKSELNLSNEQYDKAYQINLGIVQKNQALQEQKFETEEERRSAIRMNNEARMSMLKNVLTEEQYTKMKEKLREGKSKVVEEKE
jgi:hypothetical protein